MRKWGIVISLLYALIVVVLLVPATGLLAGADFRDIPAAYAEWVTWIPVALVVASQAALLFLPVDTSQKRLKPRGPVIVSCIVTATLFALLSVAAFFSVGVAIRGDKLENPFQPDAAGAIGALLGAWLVWGIVFYFYARTSSNISQRATSWLLRGSILELLIAVPCHIIVRRRGDCSAPLATSFGITSGIAIMLLSFGPSVLLLYKKRLDSYSQRQSRSQPLEPGL